MPQICPAMPLINYRVGNTLKLLAAARAEIKRTGLVAPDNAGRFGSDTCQLYSEARRPREVTTARNRENHRHFRYAIEGLRRHDQHRPAALLLVTRRRVETDQPDFATLHQRSSSPTGLL